MLRQILVVFIFFLSYCSSPPKAPISNSINTSLENSSQTTRDYFSNERQYITIYGREVYSKLSNESISLYDQIKNSTNIYGSENDFYKLYLYNLYNANPEEIAKLHEIRDRLADDDVSFYRDDELISPYAVTHLVNNPDFFTSLTEEYGIVPFELYALVSNILSHFIREKDLNQLTQWTELFSKLYPLKKIFSHYENIIEDYHPRPYMINVVISALEDPVSLAFLQEKGYISKDTGFLYRQFLENFIKDNDYYGAKMIDPFLTAYPTTINYIDTNDLSIFFPYAGDSNSINILVNKGLNTNTSTWKYQITADQIILQISELDSYNFQELLADITNINTIANKIPLDYEHTKHARVFLALIKGLDRGSYKTNEFKIIAQTLKNKGLDVNHSISNDYKVNETLLKQSDTLTKYLQFFQLPTNTSFTNCFPDKELLAQDPYNYAIKTSIDHNSISDMEALIDKGYITEQTAPFYLEYAIQIESVTASTLSEQNIYVSEEQLELIKNKQRRNDFFSAVHKGDWEEFLKYAQNYDINITNSVGNTILWTIFNSINYRNDYHLSTNHIKIVRFLESNNFNFGATNEYGETAFSSDNLLNNYNDMWIYDTFFTQYISEKLPIPDTISLYGKTEPPYEVFLNFVSDVNDTNNILQMLYDQEYFSLSDPGIQQIFLRAVRRGNDNSVKFFIDNGIDLSVTNEDGKNVIELAWELDNSASYDFSTNPTSVKDLIFDINKEKVLKSFPQFSKLFYYSPQHDPQAPNSIQSIQYRLIQNNEETKVFYPLDFTKEQYVLFEQNITKETPIYLLMDQNGGRYRNNAKENNLELLQFLLDNGADPNYIDPISTYNTLMLASTSDNVSNMIVLLQQEKINLSYTNIFGNTVLHHMAQGYSENSWEMSPYDIFERISVLPANKIDANVVNNNNMTFYWLLNSAAFGGRETVMRELIDLLKINTNIGQKTESGGQAQVVG